MESKGKALETNDIPCQKKEDIEMEDHQENEEEPGYNLAWDNLKLHCRKKQRQDGQVDVLCKYCMRIFKYENDDDYEKLEQHMHENHPQEFAIEASQMQVTEYASSQSSSQAFVYCHEKVIEYVTKMVAMHRLRFDIGDSGGGLGKYITRALNPEYKNISAKTVIRTLKGFHKKEKKELIDLFSNLDCFFIGCDLWSEYCVERVSWWNYSSYIRVTCYWIDNNWERQQRVLGFRMVDEMDSIENKFMFVKEVLEEYKLDSKKIAICFDNTLSNVDSIDELHRICRNVFHTKLDCHVLNLCINSCVKDCLKHLEDFIDPIHDATSDIYYDDKVREEWKTFCKNQDKRPVRFPRIAPKYWNLTYKLLKYSFEYRQLLCEFIANNVPEKTINLHHWDFCENLFNVLRISKNAINTFCGVYNPTSHLFLVEALNIVGELQEAEKNVFLKDGILAMKKQWLNHYRTIPSVYLIAFVFDPRCKLEGLEEYLTVYYDLLSLEHEVNVQEKVSEIKSLIYELYSDIYASQSSTSSSCSTHATPLSNELGLGDRMLQQRHQRSRASNSTSFSEVDCYLTTFLEFDDSVTGKEFAVLEWWKKHECVFPCLSKLVKQILGAPVSTSTVKEALWDDCMKMLSERESCMGSALLEAQVCVGDWSKVEFKSQEQSESDYEDDDYYTDYSETSVSEDEDKNEE